ncbi:hypothetical protein GWI33_011469 [Rhynchophorus ferrugineus]|uniref:HotDog ACOT-type domain-containing protein n=1 Tax=Rhynchophorus ferrugineus TaxID=354439 RepID=A0A834I6X7_RHYFE|nr:hypothetical protein GWI33_011469 [Rhynchophorus ferrugineus]
MPADSNWSGDIFGGWLVSQMDIAAAIHCERVTEGRCVTISIHEMTFLVPVKIGDVISCYTEIMKVGNTSLQVHVEVWGTSNCREYPNKVTEGLFTFVAVDESGKKRKIPESIKQEYNVE